MRKLKRGRKQNLPRVVGLLHDNWDATDEPGVIFNPEASITSHLTWTWSEARALEKIAERISLSGDSEAASTASIFLNRLEPMAAQLEYLIRGLRSERSSS